MAKTQTVFTCGECGRREAKWLGHCPDCGAWDSFVEEMVAAAPRGRGRGAKTGDGAGGSSAAGPVRLSEVVSSAAERFTSGIDELDRVLGGGIVPGSLVLVGGEPGIGKSTLLLQVLDNVAADRPGAARLRRGVGGAGQDARRAHLPAAPATSTCSPRPSSRPCSRRSRPRARRSSSSTRCRRSTATRFTSAPGSVSQVREAAGRFLRLAKDTGTAVFLVGHVTKDGAIAGPRVLEHMVDTVLQFEGDRYRFYRTLRAAKNRFGSTNELGIFEMTGAGLRDGAPTPPRLFLSEAAPAAGSAVHVAVEGTPLLPRRGAGAGQPHRAGHAAPRRRRLRPQPPGHARRRAGPACRAARCPVPTFLLELQAEFASTSPRRTSPSHSPSPQPQRDVPLPAGAAVFGEISLTGELRSCSQSERRVAEAGRAGFDRVVVPAADARRAGGRRRRRGRPARGVRRPPERRRVDGRPSGATNDEWGV